MAKFGKRNHVSLSVLDTSLILMGSPKVGKTSILKEVYEKVAGEDGYMFLEMYREKGASKIEGISYEDVETWEKFKDLVSDIEENKDTDYPDLKVIVIDTWDNAVALAEKEVIRLYNKKHPDDRKTSIASVEGGYGRGYEKAADLLDEMLFRLEQVGIKVSIIMHVKTKDVQDLYSEKTFQQITSDVMQKYFSRLKRNIDLIAVAYIEREIFTEKTGKKGFDGKEKLKGIVKDEVRKIKFRDSNYAIDAGGRLKYIVDEIPFDSDAFIKAIEDALKQEVESGGVSLTDRKKEDAKREKEEKKIASENSKAAKERNKIDVEKNEELVEIIKEKFNDLDKNDDNDASKIAEFQKLRKKYGISSFKDVSVISTENLQSLADFLSA